MDLFKIRANCKTPNFSKIALLRPFASLTPHQPTRGWVRRQGTGSLGCVGLAAYFWSSLAPCHSAMVTRSRHKNLCCLLVKYDFIFREWYKSTNQHQQLIGVLFYMMLCGQERYLIYLQCTDSRSDLIR